jgi:hypothetical protein
MLWNRRADWRQLGLTFIARAVTGVEIWNDAVSFQVSEWLRSNKLDIIERYKLLVLDHLN